MANLACIVSARKKVEPRSPVRVVEKHAGVERDNLEGTQVLALKTVAEDMAFIVTLYVLVQVGVILWRYFDFIFRQPGRDQRVRIGNLKIVIQLAARQQAFEIAAQFARVREPAGQQRHSLFRIGNLNRPGTRGTQ